MSDAALSALENAKLVLQLEDDARLNALLASVPDPHDPAGTEQPASPARIVTLQTFADVDEPGAAPLIGGGEHGVVFPQGGDAMFYGVGGSGKTTLELDLACHLAAGDNWLGIPVPAPVRVLLIENEGPRPLFRVKAEEKLAAWAGSPIGNRLLIVEEPWAAFSFAEEQHRQWLAEQIDRLELNVVCVGPVTRVGMEEAGTLQQVRDFMGLVDTVRRLSGRQVTFPLVHHENRGGQVSGAWEPAVDTLMHVQGQGHGRTRLYFQKARWSTKHHGTALNLLWADGASFAVEDSPELDDATLANQILDAVGDNPGLGWTRIEEATPGVGKQRRREIRDGLFADGKLLNVVKQDGREAAIRECPERKPARLYLASDPIITHLRPDPGADAAQTAPTTGAGPPLHLRRAPRPIRGAGVGAAPAPTPEDDLERLDDLREELGL